MIGSPRRPRNGNPKSPTLTTAPGLDGGWLRPMGIWVVAVTFGSLTMASVVALLVWDAIPQVFPPRAHLLLGATPLALIAVSFLVYQAARQPRPFELVKAVILAAAFLSWAANQLLPDSAHAVLFNDLAIALFVLDVFLSIVGRPPLLHRDVFTETRLAPELQPRSGSENGTTNVHPIGVEYPGITPAHPER